ncbi:prepilin-type N-terminal cleavage/methylation domain-containing protein [Phormidium sp. FACHB-1136]|uniref:PilW family protein n=1 Tax=Phormidium sp. FACHB-1136 TaxID=2692848 RepID=UPI001686D113|nr:prepilin-type N-terminal cleavage/methylation domain-containing protein [Phormidium sp. FACHB-1136]MBD2428804.1 prepilin-type N-terminal cleavage/methylation domain-containing protein [Phormidium sp. FACHB-1136]
MAAQSPHPLTRWLLGRRRASRQQGFTLTELLVSLIMGTLIMGSLLYLVVELLGVNAREERLTQVQQDTRRALDYMSREVREAVFIYTNPTAVVSQLTNAPPQSTAVLAFWHLRDIEDQIGALNADCTTYGTPEQRELCGILKLRRSVYDLVVYFVRPNTAGDIWSGPNRIIRYELTAFSDLSQLTYTTGYVDPSLPNSNFAAWEKAGGASSTTATAGTAAVLTDSIDDDASAGVGCPTGLSPSPDTNPADGIVDANNFFTCTNPTATASDNQTLYLFLRGSADPNDGSRSVTFGPVGEGSRLPTLNTEIQIRGVLQRSGG